MNDAQRARLDDLQKKKVATKDEQSWKPGKKLPTITDTNEETGEYKYNSSTTSPDVKDLQELYKKIIVILREIEADNELKENDPTKKFLETFYGSGRAVEQFTIKSLADAKDIAKYIRSNLDDYTSFFNGEIKEKDLSSLADKLDDDSYVSDTKTLKTLDKFLNKINYYYQWDNSRPLPTKDLPACLGHEVDVGGVKYAQLNTGDISKLREKINTPEEPSSFDIFNEKLPDLFNQLVTDEKLREKFSSKDTDGQITKWINKGLSKSNYKDLAPLYEDKKTLWKNAQEKLKKHYNDTLGKFKQKHNRHIYSTNARYIVAELIKKGVKPTDGTEKILGTLDAIKGNLPTPVKKQLDWCKETLSKFKDQDFFKNALKNGKQMNTLVMEIIKEAAHNGKENEAKVLLEMLSVMRYTSTTSSIRDKLHKMDFVLFSDPNISLNKENSFIQSFMKGVDASLKYTMLGAFEVANIIKNKYNERGLKFKEGTEKLDKRIKDSVERKDVDRRKIMENLMAFWNAVNNSKVSKDYNLFKKHSTVQKAADTVAPNANQTKQQADIQEYFNRHNIGRD